MAMKDQHPDRHGDEGHTQHPAQHIRAELRGHPGTHNTRECVVDQCGGEDAQNNGPGFAKAGSKYKCQQLGLVTHFSEGDDACGDEESFHDSIHYSGRKQKTNDCTTSPA